MEKSVYISKYEIKPVFFSADNIAITAAHCMDGAFSAIMYLGTHDIYGGEECEIQVVSRDFAIHEYYDRNTLKNDIAYIRFPSPVTFSKDHLFSK